MNPIHGLDMGRVEGQGWRDVGAGYRDSARLESWTKKMRGHPGKKLHRNREILVQRMVGVVGA